MCVRGVGGRSAHFQKNLIMFQDALPNVSALLCGPCCSMNETECSPEIDSFVKGSIGRIRV